MRASPYLAAALAVALGLGAVAPAAAQTTPYGADGRPEFCLIIDIAANRQMADEVVGQTLDELGYSRYFGAGQRLMNSSRRAVAWLFYVYSQDSVHWRGDEAASRDLRSLVDWVITDRDGAVPTLADRYIPIFNRAAIGCRSSVRG